MPGKTFFHDINIHVKNCRNVLVGLSNLCTLVQTYLIFITEIHVQKE